MGEHRDFLLDVFYLVLRLLQVDDLDGHNILRAPVHALEHLAERPLADALQLLDEDLLGIQPRLQRRQRETGVKLCDHQQSGWREDTFNMFNDVLQLSYNR